MKTFPFFKVILLTSISVLLIIGCSKGDIFSVHIIDVGQGDSILIHTEDNINILIDCGDEDAEHKVYSHLRKNGIRKIDMLIASHTDSDHIGSMDYIIDKMDIGLIYITDGDTSDESYDNILDSCREKSLKIKYLHKGDSFKINNNTKMEILSPSYVSENNNDNSAVILIKYFDNKLLFMGDAEKSVESNIISSGYNISDIDFLKVGHHGSSSSSTKEFIDILSPEIAAISCGYRNRYGHPHKTVIKTLKDNDCSVFRTDMNGTLEFYFEKDNIYTKKKYRVD